MQQLPSLVTAEGLTAAFTVEAGCQVFLADVLGPVPARGQRLVRAFGLVRCLSLLLFGLLLLIATKELAKQAHSSSPFRSSRGPVGRRAVTATDRTHFVRIGLEGALRHVGRDDPGWQRYHDIYAAKFPFGDALLQEPEVELYVLTPAVMRVAVGAQPAVDIALPSPYEGEMPASLRPAGPLPPSPSPDIGGRGGERREPGAGAG